MASMLDRRPPRPRAPELAKPRVLRSELRALARELSLPKGTIPNSREILDDLGRSDVWREVLRLGGLTKTADALGFITRRARNRWTDPVYTAREVWAFIQETQGGGGDPLPCPLDEPGATTARVYRDGDQTQRTVATVAPDSFSSQFRMPTHKELAARQRQDLRWALRRHGHTKIAELLRIKPNRTVRVNSGAEELE